VLADMALDLEGVVALTMRVCRALDRASSDPREAAYARLLTPVAKYWICKIAAAFVFEAMECLGGNGYVEESILPRLYREAPVNAIWEGSGNVMCLDVLRALRREDEAKFYESLSRSIAVPLLDGAALTIESANEANAPALVGQLALMASVAELKASAPQAIVEAFARTRLVQRHGPLYGAHDIDPSTVELLLQRALPES
jgi:putative acyl-CoA dehydrogenase